MSLVWRKMGSMDNQPKYDLPAFYTRRDRQRISTPWYETSWGMVVVLPFALLSLVILLPILWIKALIFPVPPNPVGEKRTVGPYLYANDELPTEPCSVDTVKRAPDGFWKG